MLAVRCMAGLRCSCTLAQTLRPAMVGVGWSGYGGHFGLFAGSVSGGGRMRPRRESRRLLYNYRGASEPLDSPESSRDFVLSLRHAERLVLLDQLNHALQQTRSQCPPGTATPEPAPTTAQLRQICLNNTVPFIGFGFLDNAIMILAGEYIDSRIGLSLGISTLAAAAWGNLISDVFGLGLAGYIEGTALRLGLKTPGITPTQADMFKTRLAASLGRTLGIVIGCLFGMAPLLFMSAPGAATAIAAGS